LQKARGCYKRWLDHVGQKQNTIFVINVLAYFDTCAAHSMQQCKKQRQPSIWNRGGNALNLDVSTYRIRLWRSQSHVVLKKMSSSTITALTSSLLSHNEHVIGNVRICSLWTA
jgi:hypothetical protein